MATRASCCTPHALDAPIVHETVPTLGGRALVGTSPSVIALDADGPLRRRLRPFAKMRGAVAVAYFARMEAERIGRIVFQLEVPEATGPVHAVGGTERKQATRGGLGDVPLLRGDAAPEGTGLVPRNIWQGRFPNLNSAADGWAATARYSASSQMATFFTPRW